MHKPGLGFFGLGALLVCLSTSSAQVPTVSPAPPQLSPTQGVLPDAGYLLGPEDVVQVDVLGRSDFSAKSKIGSDGKIQLPLLGSVDASNRTVLQLSDDIKRALQ